MVDLFSNEILLSDDIPPTVPYGSHAPGFVPQVFVPPVFVPPDVDERHYAVQEDHLYR